MQGGRQLSADDILKAMPHRYPFLLVDRVADIQVGKMTPIGDRVIAYKGVSQSEPYFQGHFPNHPVMPGVLILEALSQAACLVIWKHVEFNKEKDHFYLTGIKRAKFRKPVVPGHLLRLEATVTGVRQNKFWTVETKAYVCDETLSQGSKDLATEAEISAAYIRNP